jgi:hypothetical protein
MQLDLFMVYYYLYQDLRLLYLVMAWLLNDKLEGIWQEEVTV